MGRAGTGEASKRRRRRREGGVVPKENGEPSAMAAAALTLTDKALAGLRCKSIHRLIVARTWKANGSNEPCDFASINVDAVDSFSFVHL